MGFLGRIGIDWRLVAAQAVNFGILTWLFARFVYRPLLRGMSSSELEKAERQMAKAQEIREQAKAEAKRELRQAKKQATGLVEQAEDIATNLKERVKQEAMEERARLTAHLKKQAESQRQSLATNLSAEARETVRHRMTDRFRQRLAENAEAAAALQMGYSTELRMMIEQIDDTDLDHSYPEMRIAWGAGTGKKDAAAAAEGLVQLLAAKLNQERVPAPSLGRNPGLLAGYRIEFAGLALERSLNRDIRDAIEKQQ